MKEHATILVKRDINTCFNFISNIEDYYTKMDDQILYCNKITEENEVIGTKYIQGRSIENKIVETQIEIINYLNTSEKKVIEFAFILQGFNSTGLYELTPSGDFTNISYTAISVPTTFLTKVLNKFTKNTDELIKSHVKKLKEVIESSTRR